jgi:hypothetical protein
VFLSLSAINLLPAIDFLLAIQLLPAIHLCAVNVCAVKAMCRQRRVLSRWVSPWRQQGLEGGGRLWMRWQARSEGSGKV